MLFMYLVVCEELNASHRAPYRALVSWQYPQIQLSGMVKAEMFVLRPEGFGSLYSDRNIWKSMK
jgi:hypothetical protein